mgnify:CR=1 FL=1
MTKNGQTDNGSKAFDKLGKRTTNEQKDVKAWALFLFLSLSQKLQIYGNKKLWVGPLSGWRNVGLLFYLPGNISLLNTICVCTIGQSKKSLKARFPPPLLYCTSQKSCSIFTVTTGVVAVSKCLGYTRAAVVRTPIQTWSKKPVF